MTTSPLNTRATPGSHKRRQPKSIFCRHFVAIIVLTAALAFVYNFILRDPLSYATPEQALQAHVVNSAIRFLFLAPMVYAGIVYQIRGVLVVWFLFLAATVPKTLGFPSDVAFDEVFEFALIALVASLSFAVHYRRLDSEKEAFASLERARQTYVSGTIRAQEDERQRVSQELHDDALQSLLVIANQSQSLVKDQEAELSAETKAKLEEVRDTVLRTAADVRRLSQDLRPSILDNMGLLPALKWLAARLTKEHGISAQVLVSGTERRLNAEAEVIMFRIVQEALNNVRRHSGATEANVTLDFAPNGLRLTVRDDGRGFLLPETMSSLATDGKLGLNGMRQRASMLGATFNIQSAPGQGTAITVDAEV